MTLIINVVTLVVSLHLFIYLLLNTQSWRTKWKYFAHSPCFSCLFSNSSFSGVLVQFVSYWFRACLSAVGPRSVCLPQRTQLCFKFRASTGAATLLKGTAPKHIPTSQTSHTCVTWTEFIITQSCISIMWNQYVKPNFICYCRNLSICNTKSLKTATFSLFITKMTHKRKLIPVYMSVYS